MSCRARSLPLRSPQVVRKSNAYTDLELPRFGGRVRTAIDRRPRGALMRRFRGVSTQYSLGGYFGHRIDIVLGDGKIGVEVKLARAVLNSSSEVYRAIGQAIVYSHRKVVGRLVVAIVAPVALIGAPALLEVCGLLEATGAGVVFVPLT